MKYVNGRIRGIVFGAAGVMFCLISWAPAQDVSRDLTDSSSIGMEGDDTEEILIEDSGLGYVQTYETELDRYKSTGDFSRFRHRFEDDFFPDSIGIDDYDETPENFYYKGNWGARYYVGDRDVFRRRFADRFHEDEPSRYERWISEHYSNEDYHSDYYDTEYFSTEQFETDPREDKPSGEEIGEETGATPRPGQGERYYTRDWEKEDAEFDEWHDRNVLVYKPEGQKEESDK